MTILGLVPARGGSVSVPRKNLIPLCSQPLIAWTIQAAQRSRLLTRFVVSTDDQEIADVAKQYGAPVEMRPPELCGDGPMFPLMRHHCRTEDAVCVLQPTCPLRRTEDIDGAIELYHTPHTGSVISFVKVEDEHPARMYTRAASTGHMWPLEGWDTHARRQDLAPLYLRSGDIYLTGRHLLANDCYFLTRPWMIPRERWCNIDGQRDLNYAEGMLRRDRPELAEWRGVDALPVEALCKSS